MLIFDLEADNLLDDATKIHCIATKDAETGEENLYHGTEVLAGIQALAEADTIVGHNIAGYDLPLLHKLYGYSYEGQVVDTLVMSRLINPDRPGGHSLDSWGESVGVKKPVHTDWSEYSEEMGIRCQADVKINALVLKTLIGKVPKRYQDVFMATLTTEQEVSTLQSSIESNGFRLDVKAALRLKMRLDRVVESKRKEVQAILPPVLKVDTTGVKKPFKKDGSLSKMAADWLGDERPDGPFSRVVWVDRKMSSPTQMKVWLDSLGYMPDEWNFKQDPMTKKKTKSSYKITESALAAMDNPMVDAYREYTIALHRTKMLCLINLNKKDTGWLSIVREDGRVAAGAIHLGAATGRFNHRGLVNIPSSRAPYGKKLRDCLVASEGCKLVGVDASGLQARLNAQFAHKHDGGQYAELVLNGDIHTHIQKSVEEQIGRHLVPGGTDEQRRGIAKNIGYGIAFGAGGEKVGSMVKGNTQQGNEVKVAFWDAIPGLKAAKEVFEKESRSKGYVTLPIDGRRLVSRSPHSALNLAAQGEEAVLMKYFMKLIAARGYRLVYHSHDETVMDVPEDEAQECLDFCISLGPIITAHYNYQVPIEFDGAIGDNYAQIH